MNAPQTREHRSARALRYALILSALLHATLLPLILWAVALRLPLLKEQTPREDVVASTSITLERRTVPRPPSAASNPSTQSQQQPQQQEPQKQRASANPPRTVPQPTSAPQTPAPQTPAPEAPHADAESQLQRRLDEQQRAYARTAKQLSSANDIHSIATLPPATPAARRVSSFDASGTHDVFLAGHGFLEPIKSWEPDAAHTCYYVSYSFQYESGASEDGTVPWPICYPKTSDEFKKPPHSMDLPTPQPGFTTTKFLTPLLKYYYNRKQGEPPQ